MILTTFDVDHEIEMNSLWLELRHTDLETGKIDWDAFMEEKEAIIDAAWKRQGEIMKMQFDSMIEDAEMQADADVRHAEFMCSQNTRSNTFPVWMFPAFVIIIYWLWIVAK